MRQSKPSIALATALALSGCAGNETPTPLTQAGALAAFKPIANSPMAPCVIQRDVAAHNSAYDTIKRGKAVVYKAPCDVDKPAPAPVKSEPKTS